METLKPLLVSTFAEFTRILHVRNPMQLDAPIEDEYASEALSILSRFNEGALHLCPDQQQQLEIAAGLVEQTFSFWFDAPIKMNLEELAKELLSSFVAAHAAAGAQQ